MGLRFVCHRLEMRLPCPHALIFYPDSGYDRTAIASPHSGCPPSLHPVIRPLSEFPVPFGTRTVYAGF